LQNKSKCKHHSFWEKEKTSFEATQERGTRKEENGWCVLLFHPVLLPYSFNVIKADFCFSLCTVEVIEKPTTETAKKTKNSTEKMDTT
jgi:hypothetical protein